MDDMAKMLESYTQGLHESFESVFERVGNSVSQSIQVMRMMNEVMESAMLQNLLLFSKYDVHSGLVIVVENRSQIMLRQTKISAQLDNCNTSFFSKTLNVITPGQQVQFQALIHDIVGPIAGFIELECISPGTQQILTKRSLFRVLYLEQGKFRAVMTGEDEEATPSPYEVAVTSDKIPLTRVRKLLDLHPIEGILTNNQGRYRFEPVSQANDDVVVYLSVKEGAKGDSVSEITISAAGNVSATSERQRRCQQILDEMETDRGK